MPILINEIDKVFDIETDLYSMDITQQLIFKILYDLKKEWNKGITPYRLQKTIYFLKEELKTNNSLRNSLIFFGIIMDPILFL